MKVTLINWRTQAGGGYYYTCAIVGAALCTPQNICVAIETLINRAAAHGFVGGKLEIQHTRRTRKGVKSGIHYHGHAAPSANHSAIRK